MKVIRNAFVLTIIIVGGIYYANSIFEPRSLLSSNAKNMKLKHKPAIVAHRGGRGIKPENTIEAMRYSYENYDADMIETDIHITKDGEFIFIHDDTLERITNGTGFIKDYTLAELKQLDFGYWFTDGKRYPYRGKGIHCNTLREGYEEFKDKNVIMSVEIKDRDLTVIDKLVDYLNTLSGYEKFMCFCCANHTMTSYFKEKTNHQLCYEASEIDAVGYVIATSLGITNLWYHFIPNENRFFHVPFISLGGIDFLDKKMLQILPKIDLEIMYFTINNKRDAAICIGKKCDGLTSDRPDIIEELLHSITERELVHNERFNGVISLDAKDISWECESISCKFIDVVTSTIPIPLIFICSIFIINICLFSVIHILMMILSLPFNLFKKKNE
ncbi:glycerophosphoryl diester phosphodiesterase, putative [Entamoeba histolytica HM-1:IMSS-B]|uniref:Glycerophosphoryl diester phosphodiesterase, putative n=6 Tax=Entamoeba histolytica TaxID=5759 RepID=C4M346_ENTH1|nr:glycerophosphoryl diester phosphodiesterase, putative [Entamoeba histolytica HM-1:IMSS]EMD43527.1 glycerophosphoryl diester phosphodiesterase, putative [Entamoeba histolytica KU27]EMH76812.1 glycerophosphoryl diester phosphodiesterase, putative [Entamoeba histolytica HM-1:IMSS-B]EMS16392.1 glycerophosphoryl diester phosphodiesterase [Entamoeba histolytica HM-3:IMSS]ENY62241.1 glycerophosphoryl diester phosphodiesterase, putative [Entamoeba histolytica HM-1:IMSS-A]GAT95727.1 glycerophosphory|eukprot:XP_652895.1 glycerophosphoryl diester phosphodiesterase, putative [Entamoeba histolytica HM-1:IMSS]